MKLKPKITQNSGCGSLMQEEMYEYLVDKLSAPHSRSHGRDLRPNNFGILGSGNARNRGSGSLV
jgi:hypothetical protein